MKGVIFDFNGTMFFDSDKHEKAWRTFLKNLIGRDVEDGEFKEHVHGRNNSAVLQHFLKKEMLKDEIDGLAEEKEQIYRTLCMDDEKNFKLVEGVEGFLDYLKERKIPFTIATASGKKNVQFYFTHLGLDKWFDFNKIVYDDGTLPGKPEPAIYLNAAKNINVNPRNCIVFEDAKSGILAAERAGIGEIIAVASTSPVEYFEDMPSVKKVICDFRNLQHLIDSEILSGQTPERSNL